MSSLLIAHLWIPAAQFASVARKRVTQVAFRNFIELSFLGQDSNLNTRKQIQISKLGSCHTLQKYHLIAQDNFKPQISVLYMLLKSLPWLANIGPWLKIAGQTVLQGKKINFVLYDMSFK